MRMMVKDRVEPLIKKRITSDKKSLAALAEQHGMPLGTLKTRVKKLTDQGFDRDKAIRLALKNPIGPQRHSWRVALLILITAHESMFTFSSYRCPEAIYRLCLQPLP